MNIVEGVFIVVKIETTHFVKTLMRPEEVFTKRVVSILAAIKTPSTI